MDFAAKLLRRTYEYTVSARSCGYHSDRFLVSNSTDQDAKVSIHSAIQYLVHRSEDCISVCLKQEVGLKTKPSRQMI